MKAALIGNGKTGSKVQEALVLDEKALFNTQNPPTVEALHPFDVVIVFVPGDAFLEMIPMLLSADIAVVSGATGVALPENLEHECLKRKRRWVVAHNFSPAMPMIQKLLRWIAEHPDWLTDPTMSLNEVHHKEKRDAPSGTAKRWVDWLDPREVQVKSQREGDELGQHELSIETPMERLTIRHEALDRALFAQGAIQAAEWVLQPNRMPGLFSMNDVVGGV
ncbi:MAG: dihydrodipicolinate reductase C-terminal domain-containing protein [Balneolaceae bacterium]|nr:dihydrodipicolinate reductase C-terminal domain-containing protein [Balneolaceae bacterium]